MNLHTGQAELAAAATAGLDVAIASVATAVPRYRATQQEYLEFTLSIAPELKSFEAMFSHTGIETRHSCMPFDWLGKPHGWPERTEVFVREALALLEQAALACMAKAGIGPGDIDALIVASTTGLAVPSLDARLAVKLGLKPSVERMPLFGIGCAGGVTGLARAARLTRSMPGAHVLFLCVELCTITGRVGDHRLENFVSSALFADGAAGVLLRSLPPAAASMGGQARIVASGEHLWPDSSHVMGWSIEDDGFGVVLSPDIPKYAARYLRPALMDFLAKHGLMLGDLDGYVMHPGGRKVLEGMESALGLSRHDLRHAWGVLRDYGNMSSPTVLFILERTLAEEPSGRHLMAAFGPGFTGSFLLLDCP